MAKIKISIIIKALNEEKNIARCITSIITATKNIDSEIILVDSLSTDNTIAIAKNFPIKIIQLKHTSDRSCGIGPQIGYLFSKGEYIFLIDGDMELEETFIQKALDYMRKNRNIDGVNGFTKNVSNQVRDTKSDTYSKTKDVDSLIYCGLYRKKSIDNILFFTNPYLFSSEDTDLGYRILNAGGKLKQLPLHAVTHYYHLDKNPFKTLILKFKRGYFFGYGQVIKFHLKNSDILKKYLIKFKRPLVLSLIQVSLVIGLLAIPFNTLLLKIVGSIYLSILILLMILKRSLSQGIYSFITTNLQAVGLLIGICLPKKDPLQFEPRVKIIKELRIKSWRL